MAGRAQTTLLPAGMLPSGAMRPRADLRATGRRSRTSTGRSGPFEAAIEPLCSPRIGRSVRTTGDGSMMASLADRSAFHKAPQSWYRRDPATDVLQVLAFVKARLKRRQIILQDFVSQFDSLRSPAIKAHRMHTSFITRNNLRRALDATGCLNDLSEEAFATLADTFTEARAQPEFRHEDINYRALCEVLQDVSDQSNSYRLGSILLDETYENLRQQLLDTKFDTAFKNSFDDDPLSRQPLSAEGKSITSCESLSSTRHDAEPCTKS